MLEDHCPGFRAAGSGNIGKDCPAPALQGCGEVGGDGSAWLTNLYSPVDVAVYRCHYFARSGHPSMDINGCGVMHARIWPARMSMLLYIAQGNFVGLGKMSNSRTRSIALRGSLRPINADSRSSD